MAGWSIVRRRYRVSGLKDEKFPTTERKSAGRVCYTPVPTAGLETLLECLHETGELSHVPEKFPKNGNPYLGREVHVGNDGSILREEIVSRITIQLTFHPKNVARRTARARRPVV